MFRFQYLPSEHFARSINSREPSGTSFAQFPRRRVKCLDSKEPLGGGFTSALITHLDWRRSSPILQWQRDSRSFSGQMGN